MKRFLLIVVAVMLTAAFAAAQEQSGEKKSKTLTMEDFEPAASKPAASSSSKKAKGSKSSKSAKGEAGSTGSRSENEGVWQQRMFETQMAIQTLTLKSVIDESNGAVKADLRDKKAELTELKAEGRKNKFQPKDSPDVEYRTKYVKLRTKVIKEEKLRPPKEPKEKMGSVYVQTNKSKRAADRKLTIPVLQTKEVQRKATKLDLMYKEIEDLKEEGRRVGVSPSVFRD